MPVLSKRKGLSLGTPWNLALSPTGLTFRLFVKFTGTDEGIWFSKHLAEPLVIYHRLVLRMDTPSDMPTTASGPKRRSKSEQRRHEGECHRQDLEHRNED
jgi:hypothetical protein